MGRLRRLASGVASLAGGVRWGLVSGAIGVLVLVAALLAVIVFVPQLAIDPRGVSRTDWLTAVRDLRTSILHGLGGLAVIAGAVVAALNLRETSRQNRAVLELQRRGQTTERFTKAIEQLGQQGPEKLDIRIGAVYALEQIARDSAELHWPIMEVLTAYLGEHARVIAAADDADWLPLPADHQAIVTVLGRRNGMQDPVGQRLDLRGACLRGARLRDANLRGADLSGVDLCAADLSGVDLREAQLFGVDFRGSALGGVDLRGADVGELKLRGVDLRSTNGLTLKHLIELCDEGVRLPHELEAHLAELIAEPASGPTPDG